MPKIYALDRPESIVIAAADYFEDLNAFRQALINADQDLFTLNARIGQTYIIPRTSMVSSGEIDIEVLLFDDELSSLDGQYLFEINFLNDEQKNAFVEKHNIVLLNYLKLAARQRDMKSYDEEINRKNSFVQDNRTISEILGLNVNDPWDRRSDMQKLRDQDNDKRMRELMSRGLISSDSSFSMPGNGKLVKEVEIVDGRVVSATAHIGERTISRELRESLIRDNERKLRAAGLQSEIVDENWNRNRLNKLLMFFNEELKLFDHKPIKPKIVTDPLLSQQQYIEEHAPSPAYYQNLQNLLVNIRAVKSEDPNISVIAVDFNTVDLYNASCGEFIKTNALAIQLMSQSILKCLPNKLQKDLKLASATIVKNTLMLCMHDQISYQEDLDIKNINTSDLSQTIKANQQVKKDIEKCIQKLDDKHYKEQTLDDGSDLKIINKIEAIRGQLEAKGVRHIKRPIALQNAAEVYEDEDEYN